MCKIETIGKSKSIVSNITLFQEAQYFHKLCFHTIVASIISSII